MALYSVVTFLTLLSCNADVARPSLLRRLLPMEGGGAPNHNNPNENHNNHNRQNSQNSNHNADVPGSFLNNNLRRNRNVDILMRSDREIMQQQAYYNRDGVNIITGQTQEENFRGGPGLRPIYGDVLGMQQIIGNIVADAREEQFRGGRPRVDNNFGVIRPDAPSHSRSESVSDGVHDRLERFASDQHETPAIPDTNNNATNHNIEDSQEARRPEVAPAPEIDRPIIDDTNVERDGLGNPLSDFSFPKMPPVRVQPRVLDPMERYGTTDQNVIDYIRNHPWFQHSDESSESTHG